MCCIKQYVAACKYTRMALHAMAAHLFPAHSPWNVFFRLQKTENGRAMLGELRAQARLVTQDRAVSKKKLGGKRKSFWNALALPGNHLFASTSESPTVTTAQNAPDVDASVILTN